MEGPQDEGRRLGLCKDLVGKGLVFCLESS